MSNRRNRRKGIVSPLLPVEIISKKSIIPGNEKRRNKSVNSSCIKRRKAERGK